MTAPARYRVDVDENSHYLDVEFAGPGALMRPPKKRWRNAGAWSMPTWPNCTGPA